MKIRFEFTETPIQLFLWIPIFKPELFGLLDGPDLLFDILRVLVAFYVITRYFAYDYRGRFFFLITAYMVVEWVILFIHGQNYYWEMAMNTVPILCVCALTEMCINECYAKMLNAIEVIGIILIAINIVTIILYPEGMDIYSSKLSWFLGMKNQQILVVLPIAVATLLMKEYEGRWRFKEILLFLLVLFCSIMNQSTTSLIAVGVLLLFSLLYDRLLFSPNMGTFIGIYLIANFGLLYFNIQNNFSWLIEGILGKSTTITGRNLLWGRTIIAISRHPLIGYGFMSKEDRVDLTGVYWAVHSHNQYLELLLTGGIFLLVMFCILLAFVSMTLIKNRELYSSKLLSVTCFVVLILFLTEAYTTEFFVFFVFMLSAHCYDIFQNENMHHLNLLSYDKSYIYGERKLFDER